MSKTCRRILILLAFLLAAPALPADEVDLSGTWLLTMDGKSPSGEKEATLTFKTGGDGVVATLSGKKGAVDCPATLAGNELSFEYVSPKKKAAATYSGRVRGDLMGGEVDMGAGRAIQWQARRAGDGAFDFGGTWTFFIQGEPRDYANLTKMTFRQDGPELVVVLTSNDAEVECRGVLEGREVSFNYTRQRRDGGGTYVANLTGTISGALMGGDVDLGEYGKTTWRATLDVE